MGTEAEEMVGIDVGPFVQVNAGLEGVKLTSKGRGDERGAAAVPMQSCRVQESEKRDKY